jgi:hypothetical protein
MYPHRIRLRGPWEYQTSASRGRLVLPASLADVGLTAGEVQLRRRFGYPGRIDDVERVWLVVERPARPMAVSLNGERLGECDDTTQWDVTARLAPRNELLVVTEASAGAPWDGVGLEVRRTAYLRGLRVWAEGDRVFASGEVVGSAEGLLDLYVVADRRTAAYLTVSASDEGTRFAATGECESVPQLVKVELVQGAVAWYTAEIDLAAPEA